MYFLYSSCGTCAEISTNNSADRACCARASPASLEPLNVWPFSFLSSIISGVGCLSMAKPVLSFGVFSMCSANKAALLCLSILFCSVRPSSNKSQIVKGGISGDVVWSQLLSPLP